MISAYEARMATTNHTPLLFNVNRLVDNVEQSILLSIAMGKYVKIFPVEVKESGYSMFDVDLSECELSELKRYLYLLDYSVSFVDDNFNIGGKLLVVRWAD